MLRWTSKPNEFALAAMVLRGFPLACFAAEGIVRSRTSVIGKLQSNAELQLTAWSMGRYTSHEEDNES
jgi:hypothetical protein